MKKFSSCATLGTSNFNFVPDMAHHYFALCQNKQRMAPVCKKLMGMLCLYGVYFTCQARHLLDSIKEYLLSASNSSIHMIYIKIIYCKHTCEVCEGLETQKYKMNLGRAFQIKIISIFKKYDFDAELKFFA